MTTSYPDFVAARFLKRPLGAEGLMHAAIGIIGEVVEYYEARDYSHRIEELGDIEFYVEAAWQVVGPDGGNQGLPSPPRRALLYIASDLLDLAKKGWVYGAPLNHLKVRELLWALRNELLHTYTTMGTTPAIVIAANQEKLLKRYPTGYTDELAAKRLDKTGGF
jgi:hypothetical protein